jgi:glycosyltransferase 2 family protein
VTRLASSSSTVVLPRGRRAAGLLISVIAVGGCAWWVSRQDAPRFPGDLGGFALLVLALFVYALNTLIRGWRWDAILRRAHVGHRTSDAFSITVVGYMGNNVLPARGGEVLRMILLAQRSAARRIEVLGSIIPERLLDGATLIALFSVFAVAGVAGAPGGVAWAVAGAIALIAGIAALLGYLALRRRGRFARFADRVRPIARASRLLASPSGAGLGAVTAAVWFGEGLVLLLAARSVDVHLSLVQATLAVVVASLSALIPALPGYVGTFDAALLFVLHAQGVHGGVATALLLLYRFVVFVPITVVGLAILIGRYGAGELLRSREPELAGSAPPDHQELLAEQPPGRRHAQVPARQHR